MNKHLHNAIVLSNRDNAEILPSISHKFPVIYADMIYENLELNWLDMCIDLLTPDGVIMIQTDYHSSAEVHVQLKKNKLIYLNDCIYVQEWGGVSNRFFPRKHDTIFIFAKSNYYKFYPERIQVPKKTLTEGLNPSGRTTKTPCDVFYDLGNFGTTSSERIKDPETYKNFQWQKPLKLMDRLLLPFSDEQDWILDPFMGLGTTGVWCVQNRRNFYGIENNFKIFELAKERISHATPNNFYRSISSDMATNTDPQDAKLLE